MGEKPGPNPLEIKRNRNVSDIRAVIDGHPGWKKIDSAAKGTIVNGIATAWTAGDAEQLRTLISIELGFHTRNTVHPNARWIMGEEEYRQPTFNPRAGEKRKYTINKGKRLVSKLRTLGELAENKKEDTDFFEGAQSLAAIYMIQLRYAISIGEGSNNFVESLETFKQRFDKAIESLKELCPEILDGIKGADRRKRLDAVLNRPTTDASRPALTNSLERTDEVLRRIAEDLHEKFVEKTAPAPFVPRKATVSKDPRVVAIDKALEENRKEIERLAIQRRPSSS